MEATKAEPPVVDTGVAWLAAVPAAILTIALIVLLGPPLGRLLLPSEAVDFWPSALGFVRPEPTEQARYLIALVGAIMVPLAILVLARRPTWRVRSTHAVSVAQLLFVAVLVCGLFCRRGSVEFAVAYFTLPTVAVALVVGLGFVAVIRSPAALTRARILLADRSRAARWGAVIVAAGATAIWLLPAIQLDSTIAHATRGTAFDLFFTFDEGLSVLNGHTPLVNYTAQYGSLWPYVIAIPLHFADGSLGGFTSCMAAITFLAMLAVYGVIRRVCGSPIGALALYLPFMATSFFLLRGTPVRRYSFADYFGVFPLRYAGPYFVAFLLARHLSGARPRYAIWIFVAAGLTLLNNGDFGVPALGATVIALVATAEGPRTRRWWGELAFEAVGGLVAAFALVSIVTLARTDQLPNLGLLFRYAHLFALAGYNMLPMPWFGFWVVIYLTFCATLAVATVMAVRRFENRVGTGMLAWVGIFGLGIGSYYAGRSHSEVLVAVFSAWSLAIVLLVAITTRSIVRERLRIGPAQLALFVGFGLLVCSLAQFPAPWRSIERLGDSGPETFQPVADSEFVAAHTTPGEPVLLLTNLGQRISRHAGVDDVMPYSGTGSMPTEEQLTETLQQLRDAGGTTVFLHQTSEVWPELLPALEHDGFRQVAASEPPGTPSLPPPDRVVMLSDEQAPAGGR